jgi:translation initiation factor 3 subunit G
MFCRLIIVVGLVQEDVYGGSVGGLPTAGSKPGGYVPPSLKNRGAGETVDSRKREENSLRVTNLSEDTREDDLRVIHHI